MNLELNQNIVMKVGKKENRSASDNEENDQNLCFKKHWIAYSVIVLRHFIFKINKLMEYQISV